MTPRFIQCYDVESTLIHSCFNYVRPLGILYVHNSVQMAQYMVYLLLSFCKKYHLSYRCKFVDKMLVQFTYGVVEKIPGSSVHFVTLLRAQFLEEMQDYAYKKGDH